MERQSYSARGARCLVSRRPLCLPRGRDWVSSRERLEGGRAGIRVRRLRIVADTHARHVLRGPLRIVADTHARRLGARSGHRLVPRDRALHPGQRAMHRLCYMTGESRATGRRPEKVSLRCSNPKPQAVGNTACPRAHPRCVTRVPQACLVHAVLGSTRAPAGPVSQNESTKASAKKKRARKQPMPGNSTLSGASVYGTASSRTEVPAQRAEVTVKNARGPKRALAQTTADQSDEKHAHFRICPTSAPKPRPQTQNRAETHSPPSQPHQPQPSHRRPTHRAEKSSRAHPGNPRRAKRATEDTEGPSGLVIYRTGVLPDHAFPYPAEFENAWRHRP
ncbi:hypothetical protein JB92DRAFT_1673349 [Gautieria morchelliformis]|nr:hypothetical protein JB92DRAFT_1673349 [Gautieria morchelliformis]